MQQLRFSFTHHSSKVRQSFELNGTPLPHQPDPTDVEAAFGLHSLDHVDEGDEYRMDTGWGWCEGTVFYRSGLQIGLTVEQWSSGLLILTASPVAEAMGRTYRAVVSTYGLDTTAFLGLHERMREVLALELALQFGTD